VAKALRAGQGVVPAQAGTKRLSVVGSGARHPLGQPNDVNSFSALSVLFV
jgi:hypothetical protein